MSSATLIVGSATISKSWRPGPVDTSFRGGANSIPAGSRSRICVARVEAHADESAGDDEILDAAVRREPLLEAVGVDTGHEEVGVLRVEPEQLVADGPADEVGVEARATRTYSSISWRIAGILAPRSTVGAHAALQTRDERPAGGVERNASVWIRMARDERIDTHYWRYHRDVFLELVPPPSGRTLDLGCGEGRLARDLAAIRHDVVGVDAADDARCRGATRAPERELHLADATDAAI